MRVISRTSVFVSGTLEHVHNLALKTPLYKNTRLAELGCFVHRSEHRTPRRPDLDSGKPLEIHHLHAKRFFPGWTRSQRIWCQVVLVFELKRLMGG